MPIFQSSTKANMKLQQSELAKSSAYLPKSVFLVGNSLFSVFLLSCGREISNTMGEFGTKKIVNLEDIHLICQIQTAEVSSLSPISLL